ncbi:MAG TPA: SxtJ family membrane protein [Phycisphaerae bacterium]|nr:SxtJ family membrane protein [Phycisphaerae bacterium]
MIKIDWNPPPKTLRYFGLIGMFAFPALAWAAHAGFAAFGLIPENARPIVAWILLGLAAYCTVSAAVAPAALKPLFIGMSVIGAPIGIAVSYVVLGIVYFLVITPIALIFKLIGRDALHRRLEPSAQTYWVKRTPTTDVKRYFRQF